MGGILSPGGCMWIEALRDIDKEVDCALSGADLNGLWNHFLTDLTRLSQLSPDITAKCLILLAREPKVCTTA